MCLSFGRSDFWNSLYYADVANKVFSGPIHDAESASNVILPHPLRDVRSSGELSVFGTVC